MEEIAIDKNKDLYTIRNVIRKKIEVLESKGNINDIAESLKKLKDLEERVAKEIKVKEENSSNMNYGNNNSGNQMNFLNNNVNTIMNVNYGNNANNTVYYNSSMNNQNRSHPNTHQPHLYNSMNDQMINMNNPNESNNMSRMMEQNSANNIPHPLSVSATLPTPNIYAHQPRPIRQISHTVYPQPPASFSQRVLHAPSPRPPFSPHSVQSPHPNYHKNEQTMKTNQYGQRRDEVSGPSDVVLSEFAVNTKHDISISSSSSNSFKNQIHPSVTSSIQEISNKYQNDRIEQTTKSMTIDSRNVANSPYQLNQQWTSDQVSKTVKQPRLADENVVYKTTAHLLNVSESVRCIRQSLMDYHQKVSRENSGQNRIQFNKKMLMQNQDRSWKVTNYLKSIGQEHARQLTNKAGGDDKRIKQLEEEQNFFSILEQLYARPVVTPNKIREVMKRLSGGLEMEEETSEVFAILLDYLINETIDGICRCASKYRKSTTLEPIDVNFYMENFLGEIYHGYADTNFGESIHSDPIVGDNKEIIKFQSGENTSIYQPGMISMHMERCTQRQSDRQRSAQLKRNLDL
ncbi:hypothetical protein SNEBB_002326 [Seison nebaliae]|nr:hypothetical protein SNEBB_002326 [Seison nebaliae]